MQVTKRQYQFLKAGLADNDGRPTLTYFSLAKYKHEFWVVSTDAYRLHMVKVDPIDSNVEALVNKCLVAQQVGDSYIFEPGPVDLRYPDVTPIAGIKHRHRVNIRNVHSVNATAAKSLKSADFSANLRRTEERTLRVTYSFIQDSEPDAIKCNPIYLNDVLRYMDPTAMRYTDMPTRRQVRFIEERTGKMMAIVGPYIPPHRA